MVLLRFVSGILCFGSSLRRTALASWVTLRVMLSEGSWRDLVELDAGIDGLDAVACLDACWPVLLELAAVWVVGLEDVLATFPLSAGLLLKRKVFRFLLLIYNFLERLRLMNAITILFHYEMASSNSFYCVKKFLKNLCKDLHTLIL